MPPPFSAIRPLTSRLPAFFLSGQAVSAVLAAQTGTMATSGAALPLLPKLAVGITDYEPLTFLRDIKANMIGATSLPRHVVCSWQPD